MIYMIEFPGAPTLTFKVGERTQGHGAVLSIKHTTTPGKYIDGVPVEEICCIVVEFADHEIQFNYSNPLMVIYRR